MAPPRQPSDYTLRVTAGPTYDLSTHVEVPINSPALTKISSDEMDIDLNVRIQNYARGLPRGSPESSAYFDREPHRGNRDQYSIGFRFTPKAAPGPSSQAKEESKAEAEGNGNGNGNGNGDGNGNGNGNGNGSPSNDDSNITTAEGGGKEGGEKEGEGEQVEVEVQAQAQGISAADLQFGNDFDHPIRNYLPPGVNTAMNILKWWIDPGLEGDAYADEPYLYGPALSSFNAVRVGRGEYEEEGGGLWVEEGASSDEELESDAGEGGDEEEEDKSAATGAAGAETETKPEQGKATEGEQPAPGQKASKSNNNYKSSTRSTSGKQWREKVLANSGVNNDPKKRQKWALKDDAKKKWVWEYGRTYAVDFYNPYIDFGKCELKLPGFGVNVLRYWDGETGLRYVLRNRLTKKPYLVILFVLYPNDMVNEDGTLKPEALKATARASGGGKTEDDGEGGAKATDADVNGSAKNKDGNGFDEDKAVEEAKRKLEGVALGEGPKEGAGAAGAGAGDDDVD